MQEKPYKNSISRKERNGSFKSTHYTVLEHGAFRGFLAQLLATTAKNFILIHVGMSQAMTVLLVGALHNARDGLSLNDTQIAWFSGILYIGHPLSSVLSGPVVDFLGRKRFLLVINVFYALGWFLLYLAVSPPMIFAGILFVGMCNGLQEAPVKTYSGEVCTPKYRGMLGAYSSLFPSVGELVIYLVGANVSWRKTSLSGVFIPVLVFFYLWMVPESPQWLVSKGRIKEAEESLCWLRGWTKNELVEDELEILLQYHEASRRRKNSKKFGNPLADRRKTNNLDYYEVNTSDITEISEFSGNEQYGRERWTVKVRAMLEASTRRPFVWLLVSMFCSMMCVNIGPSMYLLSVSVQLKLPIDGHWITVITSSIGILSILASMCSVRMLGKRMLLWISFSGIMFCNLLIGLYAYLDPSPFYDVTRWIPLVLFEVSKFFIHLGPGTILWLLISEVFPYRTRSLASGLIPPFAHLSMFIISRTYLPLESVISLHGIFSLNGLFALLAAIHVYILLPETEGRSLMDVENFYKKGGRPNKEERSVYRGKQAKEIGQSNRINTP